MENNEIVPSRRTAEEHLYAILDMAAQQGVSDVHVHPNDGIWTEKSGNLKHYTDKSVMVAEDEILVWLRAAESGDAQRADPFGEKGHASVAFFTGTYRIRGTFRKSVGGTSCTFRVIPSTIPNADALGIPQAVQDLTKKKSGLILFEGPTGSGKTTAIAGLINLINRTRAQHIYLVEHPIEFMHEPDQSLFTQREIGIHASDYASALEDALRSKPNVIVIGELLNPATARAALHAATTGHLVITTAHAGTVAEAIDGFIGQFTADEQPQIRSRLGQSLLAIMVQKLVPKIGGGLVPARELLINDLNFAEVIKDGLIHQVRQQMEGTKDSFSLEQSLADLVEAGLITKETAYAETRTPGALDEKLSRL